MTEMKVFKLKKSDIGTLRIVAVSKSIDEIYNTLPKLSMADSKGIEFNEALQNIADNSEIIILVPVANLTKPGDKECQH